MAFRRRPKSQLFDASKIDLVAVGPQNDIVELHILRHLPWSGADDEVHSLQEKVNTHVGYALDGQMHADYPETVGLPWRIVVDSADHPDKRSAEIIEAIKGPVAQYGGALDLRIIERR